MAIGRTRFIGAGGQPDTQSASHTPRAMRLHRSVLEMRMKSSVRRRGQRVETATRWLFAGAESLAGRPRFSRLMAGMSCIAEMQAACAYQSFGRFRHICLAIGETRISHVREITEIPRVPFGAIR